MTKCPRLSRPRRAPSCPPSCSPGCPRRPPRGAARGARPRRLCLDEGVRSLLSSVCCSYSYSTYKQEWGRNNDRRPSSSSPFSAAAMSAYGWGRKVPYSVRSPVQLAIQFAFKIRTDKVLRQRKRLIRSGGVTPDIATSHAQPTHFMPAFRSYSVAVLRSWQSGVCLPAGPPPPPRAPPAPVARKLLGCL